MLRRLFGNDVAENDAHLSEYFVETPAYRMALSGEKRFIIGRKGSGKSAICQQLQRQLPQSGALCIPVAPQRIQLTALKLGLRDIKRWAMEADTLLQRVWYYGLLCETALAITRSCKKENDSDFSKIAAFIEQRYNHQETNVFDRLLNTTTLFLQHLEFGLGGVTVRHRGRIVDTISVETEMENLRAPMASFLGRNLPQGIYILIDNLDDGWDNSAEANAFVRGLLLAIYEICQPNIPVRMIVFLRSDMYDCVTRQFQHIDKYRQFQEHIHWGKKEIMHLVAQRMRVNLKYKATASTLEVWEKVFDGKKSAAELATYIIERSLLRPREVLQFCRLAADRADLHGHPKITFEDVDEAENEYSQWKVDDLSNEFLYSFPGLKEKILQRFAGRAARLSRQDLKYIIEDALTDPHTGEIEWMGSSPRPDDLIKVLYEIGFLKAVSQRREWESALHLDFNLELADEFIFHPAFRRHLKIGPQKSF